MMRRILRAKVNLRQGLINRYRRKTRKNNEPRDVLLGRVVKKKVFIIHLYKWVTLSKVLPPKSNK